MEKTFNRLNGVNKIDMLVMLLFVMIAVGMWIYSEKEHSAKQMASLEADARAMRAQMQQLQEMNETNENIAKLLEMLLKAPCPNCGWKLGDVKNEEHNEEISD